MQDIVVDGATGQLIKEVDTTVIPRDVIVALPYDNGDFGNAGFLDGKQVIPIIRVHRNEREAKEEDEDSDKNEQNTRDGYEEPVMAVSDDEDKDDIASHDQQQEETDNPSPPDDDDEREKADDEEGVSPDDVLHQSVCQALVNLSNKDLPMLVSTFYSQHVLPNRPTGSTLELKKTSWKKFGNYLRDKIMDGLVRVGPDPSNKNKKNADPMALLVSFDRKHADLRGISKSANASSTSTTAGKPSKIVLVSLYVIPHHWVSLLRLNDDDVKAVNATSEDRRGTGMLTMPEVRAIMDDYIEREGLTSKESNKQGYVVLDGPLTDIFYKKKTTKSDANENDFDYPTQISRKEFSKQITTKLSPAFALVSMPGSKIIQLSKGSPPKIEIDVSRRQSKKFVTRVRGLERYGIDPAYFAKDISKRIAVPATIDTDPASSGRAALRQKNDVELVFGGNVVDEIEAILSGDDSLSTHGGVKDSEYSIPIQCIDVILRKGVPARKKTAGGGGSKSKK